MLFTAFGRGTCELQSTQHSCAHRCQKPAELQVEVPRTYVYPYDKSLVVPTFAASTYVM